METEQVEHLHSPRIAWFYDQTGDTNMRKGMIRLTMAPDGHSATGLIGGYRDWRDLYAENTFAQDGGQQGTREHEDAVSLYYALRRNADGMICVDSSPTTSSRKSTMWRHHRSRFARFRATPYGPKL